MTDKERSQDDRLLNQNDNIMTRKESDALLKEMREKGIAVKVSAYMGENCISRYSKHVAKIRDGLIRMSGYGAWACRNSFSEFYCQMRECTLIEKLPADYYEWGL